MSYCIRETVDVTARKKHSCTLCGEAIEIGSKYIMRTGVNPGDGWWSMKMHPECHKLEATPGYVDWEWYEDVSEPAFERPRPI